MKATKKPRSKSEARLLDQATDNLLRALKKDMLQKEGHLDNRSQVRVAQDVFVAHGK